jgi:phage FluMu protein Com
VQGDREVVVKNAILRVDQSSGLVTAKCPRCKSWVEVPLRYLG